MEEEIKNSEVEKSEKEDLNQEAQKLPMTEGLLYEGSIKVSIQNGKKTISTRVYHNTGRPNLFRFLCYCLAGQLYSDQRPCRICLYNKSNQESEKPAKSWKAEDWNRDLARMPSNMLYDTTPVVQLDKQENYTITYHFRIPYSFFASGQEVTVYKAALFSENINNTEATDIYAYYNFTTNDMWDPIIIDTTLSGNYSIIIEWTMTIKNVGSTMVETANRGTAN